MTLESAVATLSETGTKDRAGERVAHRLVDVQALLGDQMRWVNAELLEATRVGVSPAVESATHLLGAGGKRVRPLAVLLASACFSREPTTAARDLAVVAELIHLATLLHDDVIDDGQERRGMPTSRRIWGNAVSVLAGDLLLTHALERASKTGVPHALTDLFATLRRLVDGEVVQLRGRAVLDVGEATYFQIVKDKTASLFAWAARSGGRASSASAEQIESLGQFGEHVGVAFQLVDDWLDYAGEKANTGKVLLADLEEGKLTLPLIRAIAKNPSLRQKLDIARAGDVEVARDVGREVLLSGACDEVRTFARQETEQALLALRDIPKGEARDLLAAVATDLASRVA